MNLMLIKYTNGREKRFFELASGKRPWGMLFAASRGSFELSFPDTGESEVFAPGEVAYIPPRTAFQRRVIEPLDFHQFAFHPDKDSRFCLSLRPGVLGIPLGHVHSWLETADRIALSPQSNELSLHILERLIIDNYLVSTSEKTVQSAVSGELEEVLEYIHENLSQKLDLAKIAERAGLSYTGLIFKFRRELEMTPTEYILMHRIKLAKRLLLETDIPISAISETCGYSSAYYFSNAFLKSTGMRPSNFRKNNLQN